MYTTPLICKHNRAPGVSFSSAQFQIKPVIVILSMQQDNSIE